MILSRRLNGIVLLDKPVGLSSNAALQRVRRLAGGIKAGHSGSLDPLASGMLPICLGEATRLAGELLAGRKAYRFTLQLGERTATGDAEGEVVERCAIPALGAARIEAVLQGFLGPQQQVPPMYSALKRDGQPLYRLARQGVTVQRAARAIRIESLRLVNYPVRDHALLELAVLCSKGTYVRVLGEDIGRALGSCARLASLRREYVEPFDEEPLVSLEQLESAAHGGHPWPLLAPDRAVSHLPALQLVESAVRALRSGRVVRLDEALACAAPADPHGAGKLSEDGQLATAGKPPAATHLTGAGRWRLYDESGRFLGLGVSDECGALAVQRLFPEPVVV